MQRLGDSKMGYYRGPDLSRGPHWDLSKLSSSSRLLVNKTLILKRYVSDPDGSIF